MCFIGGGLEATSWACRSNSRWMVVEPVFVIDRNTKPAWAMAIMGGTLSGRLSRCRSLPVACVRTIIISRRWVMILRTPSDGTTG
ncbi:hypothetical protein GCM10027600_08830 [Nocardioides ginsengisegetis]